jgi:hypothetical protein
MDNGHIYASHYNTRRVEGPRKIMTYRNMSRTFFRSTPRVIHQTGIYPEPATPWAADFDR